jgi:hypothetical protein
MIATMHIAVEEVILRLDGIPLQEKIRAMVSPMDLREMAVADCAERNHFQHAD